MRTPKTLLLIILMLASILCIGCEYPNSTKEDAMTDEIEADNPSPTESNSKSALPSSDATASPSLTEAPGEDIVRDLPQQTPSSTPAPTSTPTPTPKPTNTPTPKPTNIPTPKPIKLTGKLDTSEGDYYVFYVVNINTGKFHHTHCRHVKKMYDFNTNYATEHGFADSKSARSWLINHGYDPCGTCCP